MEITGHNEKSAWGEGYDLGRKTERASIKEIVEKRLAELENLDEEIDTAYINGEVAGIKFKIKGQQKAFTYLLDKINEYEKSSK